MAKRELIYKDDAHRAVLTNAPSVAWCISSIPPVCEVDTETHKPVPKMDDYWIARIAYWGEKSKVDVVMIFYVWENGEVDFIPCAGIGADPIRASECESFELLEKIEVDKYR